MYTDLKTFEDCCRATGVPETVPAFADVPEKYRADMEAFYRVRVENEAINEGQKRDYDNFNVRKYEPWMYQKNPGSGFVLLSVADVSTYSYVGARLSFVSDDRARYYATQFQPDIDRYMKG